MAYGAVHAGFFENAKYLAALRRAPESVVLYLWGLAYCNEQLTDGAIAEIQIRRRVEFRKPLALADVLCDVGLWDRTSDGYCVHDFLEYNEAAARVKAKQKAAADRQAAWRANHRDEASGRYVRNALRDALPNALRNATNANASTTQPNRTPDPIGGSQLVNGSLPKLYKGIPEITATAEELRGIAEANGGY